MDPDILIICLPDFFLSLFNKSFRSVWYLNPMEWHFIRHEDFAFTNTNENQN